MDILKNIFDFLSPGIPMVIAIVLGTLALYYLRRFLENRFKAQVGRSMRIQLIMLATSFILLIVIIIVSPLKDSQQGQLLSLIGIVLSAAIALSSTSFIGNAMAGLMLRAVKGFRIGDYISVGDHFGRVSDRGLFHIEVQTIERDLTIIPNLQLVTHPVKVIRQSGTMIYAEVSLGYDVPRQSIKQAMLAAAENCELQDAYVHIMNLGDFSVTYRVSGLLVDVKRLISMRAKLRETVLDELHGAGIEIVSPTFMNTRQFPVTQTFIPDRPTIVETTEPESSPEDVIFDKADEAVSLEKLKEKRRAVEDEIRSVKERAKESEVETEKAELESRLERLVQLKTKFDERIQSASENHKAGD